jgi:hypothetical protein
MWRRTQSARASARARIVRARRELAREQRDGLVGHGHRACARVVGAREGRVVGQRRHGQALAVIEIVDRVGLDAVVGAAHVLPLVAAPPRRARLRLLGEAGRVGVQRHVLGHVVDQAKLLVDEKGRRRQVLELAGEQGLPPPRLVVHDQAVARRHVGEHDDLHARVLEHRRVARGRLLLVLDLLGRDDDAAPVRLLGRRAHLADLVERAVVADCVLAVGGDRARVDDDLRVVDRQGVGAVARDHEMLGVVVDDQRGVGARIGRAGRRRVGGAGRRGGGAGRGGAAGEQAGEHPGGGRGMAKWHGKLLGGGPGPSYARAARAH